MWTEFNVRWEFLTELAAGVPSDPNVMQRWLDSRKPTVKPPEGKTISEIAEEVIETIEAVEPEPARHVFQRPQGIVSVRAATVRAHIKDCARILSSLYVGQITGEKSFAVRVANGIYWPPDQYWIPILNRAGPVTEVTGERTKFVHARTPKGPIAAIKVYEYIADAVMEFRLLILTQPNGKLVISEPDLKTIFLYGGVHGYGPERSDDCGRYTFSITRKEE